MDYQTLTYELTDGLAVVTMNRPDKMNALTTQMRAEIEHAFTQAGKDARCVVITGAGGAAHLPGMAASMTNLPVLGVPVESKALQGMDSLLSIVQMPKGVPVGTLAIGHSGAVNAGLMAASIVALQDEAVAQALAAWRARQTDAVPDNPDED